MDGDAQKPYGGAPHSKELLERLLRKPRDIVYEARSLCDEIAGELDEGEARGSIEIAEVLTKEVHRLRAENAALFESLDRIVNYYDDPRSGDRLPAMEVQAKARHENTMFGEARKLLTDMRQTRNRLWLG